MMTTKDLPNETAEPMGESPRPRHPRFLLHLIYDKKVDTLLIIDVELESCPTHRSEPLSADVHLEMAVGRRPRALVVRGIRSKYAWNLGKVSEIVPTFAKHLASEVRAQDLAWLESLPVE